VNQKVLLLIGLTLFAIFGYIIVVNAGRNASNPVPVSVITLMVFIALVALVIVWKPDPPK
jgi:uncharacterized protein with PQ loop repeat